MKNTMDVMDELESFIFLKNQLNAYYKKDCMSKAVVADVKNAADRFLDWLHGDHIDTAAELEFCRLTPLELYCLHDVIQNIAPERQRDLQSMHNKLAQIFEARDERALFWLSRFFEEKERFFQGNAERHMRTHDDIRNSLTQLFEDMMTPSWNDLAEADVAFLRAVAYYEFNYFKWKSLEVDKDKLSLGLASLEKFQQLSLAASDSTMLQYFARKCTLDHLSFVSKSSNMEDRASMTNRWRDFIRQIATEFGHHPFLVKVVSKYGSNAVTSLEDSLAAIQTAQSILKKRERRNLSADDVIFDNDNAILGKSEDEDVNNDTFIQSPQMAALLMKSGTILLKLNREMEGKHDLNMALCANADGNKRTDYLIQMTLRHYNEGAVDITKIDRIDCDHGKSCWYLPQRRCFNFHPRSHLSK